MNTFGKRIKELRLNRHMTQKDLADAVGYTDKSTIAKIESGAIDLTQSKIAAIAKALRVTVGDILGPIDDDPEYDITQDEYDLILLYRQIDDSDKLSIKRMIRGIIPEYKQKEASHPVAEKYTQEEVKL